MCIRDSYTARELDTRINERLAASRHLNGWLWCLREASGESGWVPAQSLVVLAD